MSRSFARFDAKKSVLPSGASIGHPSLNLVLRAVRPGSTLACGDHSQRFGANAADAAISTASAVSVTWRRTLLALGRWPARCSGCGTIGITLLVGNHAGRANGSAYP